MGLKEVLLEKVSKQDIMKALSNPNVMVGAEFEFKLKDFNRKYKEFVLKAERLEEFEYEYAEYEDELEQWMNGDINDVPIVPSWAAAEGYESGEEIPPPDELFPYLNVNRAKLFDYLVRDFLPVDYLPFDNYIISSYHKETSSTDWMIKPDGSLGLNGIEMVTPVLPLKEFLEICPKVFEFINDLGPKADVDDACGLHLSISLKNVKSLGDVLDITKLSLFVDEGYIYNFFDTREFNTYARSAHDTIRKSLIVMNDPKLALQLIDDEGIKKEFPTDHYMAVNIEHLNTKNEYIEFRYIGGTNYTMKWDKIKTILAHYIHSLSLACDEQYLKKEYEHKLSRLLNKIQLFSVVTEMTKLFNDDTIDRTDIKFKRKWKDLWEAWDALYIYKKAVDADVDTKNAKKGFLRLCRMLDIEPDEIIWDFTKYKSLK